FRRVSGATDALFLFSIIPKAGLEKSEDFSRPALFLETYVTASTDQKSFARIPILAKLFHLLISKTIVVNYWVYKSVRPL
ncbi:hypothetical protein, partial [Pediococcus acidilactici]|uniref:hypothetical protein n=1 Tax=Pediococcus acidilactici TaxID=1254 RepID=UPI001F42D3F7